MKLFIVAIFVLWTIVNVLGAPVKPPKNDKPPKKNDSPPLGFLVTLMMLLGSQEIPFTR